VASFLDLAVIALAVMVCISMALLGWTLGVTVTGVLRRTRHDLINARIEMAVLERRLRGTTSPPPLAGPATTQEPEGGE
jgi:hypothetical protein